MSTVRAVVADKRGGAVELSYEEVTLPEIGADELMVRPAYVGVCGSDLDLIHGRLDRDFPVRYPHVIGHEWSGVVSATGKLVSRFSVGDAVVGHGDLGANHWLGVTDDGAMAESFVVPESMCFGVPASVELRRAALIEPLACCVRGLQVAGGTNAGDRVVVLGCGGVGLAMVGLVNSTLATVYAVDPSPRRLAIAEQLGAALGMTDTDADPIIAAVRGDGAREGADLVIEASGVPSAQAAALLIAGREGRVLYMGVSHQPAEKAALNRIRSHELRITSSTGAPPSVWPATLRLLERSEIDLASMVSNTYEFGSYNAAFRAASEAGKSTKVLLRPAER